MRLDDRLRNADEHRAADLAIVHLLLQGLDAPAAEEIAELRGRTAQENPLDLPPHILRRALNGLEQDVAGEAVGDDHVSLVVQHVARFNIPGEMQQSASGRLLQEAICLLMQPVALGILRAVVQQRHARLRLMQCLSGIK